MAIPLSCYIRTKNEERQIGAAVRAARSVADDVVVIDSGSTDRTRELAIAAGARVIDEPWRGWGKQKRVGEDACRNDWLLDLDADEIVSEALAEEIRALFSSGEPPRSIYEMDMATIPPVGGPWLTFNLVDRRKLYDRRVVRQPDHEAWDQFKPPRGVAVGRLRAPLLHYSFDDLGDLEEKFTRNSKSSALASRKPLWLTKVRLAFGGPFYFWNQYVRRGLWRAGWYGLCVASIAAHGRWLKDARMLEMAMKCARDETGNSYSVSKLTY